MSDLRLADGFALPLDVAGETIAILAKRGAGKTNTATVLVEELVAAHVQTVIVDPVGAWWGIRSSAEGEHGAGLPVPIIGGQHGDIPLEPTAGRLIADVVVDTGSSLLLDLSDFRSKAELQRFIVDFAERLYRRKARASSLLHVVFEEADEFAPQRPAGGWKGDAGNAAAAVEQIVRRGRSRGLGVTLITQRSAVLNKDVLTQADVLVVMRTTGPQDVKAIKEWVAARGDAHGETVIESLPSLSTGEAWFWNPERDLLKRTQVRRRRTFDSSATPKAGEVRATPADVAPIDLTTLGEQIAATVEKSKATDPKELQKRLREAELQIRELSAARPPEPVETLVEVPVLTEQMMERLTATIAPAAEALVSIKDFVTTFADIAETLSRLSLNGHQTTAAPAAVTAGGSHVAQQARTAAVSRRREPSAAPLAVDGDVRLGKGETKVLQVLAEYPEGRTHNELAFLAGYSAKASTIGVMLSQLRKAGLVEPGQPIRPTQAGLDAVGGVTERPTGRALLNQWLQHPRMGEPERTVLLALVTHADGPMTNEELADATGYSPTASTLGVILSKLRKLGLVSKGQRQLAPEFREAIEA